MREVSRVCYRLQRESASALQDLKAVTQVRLFEKIFVLKINDSIMDPAIEFLL